MSLEDLKQEIQKLEELINKLFEKRNRMIKEKLELDGDIDACQKEIDEVELELAKKSATLTRNQVIGK